MSGLCSYLYSLDPEQQKYFTSVGKCTTKWADAYTLDLGTVPTFKFPVILNIFQINPCLHRRSCPFLVLVWLLTQHIPTLLVATQESEKKPWENKKNKYSFWNLVVKTIQRARSAILGRYRVHSWRRDMKGRTEKRKGVLILTSCESLH